MVETNSLQLPEAEARECVLSVVRGNSSLLKNPDEYSDHPLAGHCYVASEAFFHLTGGYDQWYVERQNINDVTHWYLRSRTDPSKVVDLTEDQFDQSVDHSQGTKTGFLTSNPSSRTKQVLQSITESQN